jgi:hypothetical protein
MAEKEAVAELLRGAYDMHIHTSPDVADRKTNDVLLAERALEAGIAGFVLKSHYVPTADRATHLRYRFPELKAYGGIALNNSVGGMNPVAVEVAGRLGARVVWLPTVDAANERHHITDPQDPRLNIMRAMNEKGIPDPGISIIDEDGKLTESTRQCLDVIAQYDMVLATGHVSVPEMIAVAKAAAEAKVQRVVITHPEAPMLNLGPEDEKELLKYNVFFERCALFCVMEVVAWDAMFHRIRELGASRTIMSTDLGQPRNPFQDEGVGIYVANLLDAGFPASDIEIMCQQNPLAMLET